MTLFCGLTKKFTFGLAVLACGQSAFAGGPFKPASFGQMTEGSNESAVSSPQGYTDGYAAQPYMMMQPGLSPMMQPGPNPMGYGMATPVGFESYPGQYSEPSTYGTYVSGESCDAYGNVLGGCGMGGCGDGACGQGDGGVCGYCGGAGCGLGGGCIGQGRSLGMLVNNAFMRVNNFAYRLLPYGEGGVATQRWYDVSVGTIALKRSTDAANFNLTSRGINGPIVLGSGNASLDNLRAGLTVQINVQTGVGSNLEVSYFGLNRWTNTATVTGTTDLYSYISGFGTTPFNGFDDTDRSLSQSVSYISALHNGELNFRRRTQEPSGFLQGSVLAGIRYFDLDEELLYQTRGENNNGTNNGLRFANFSTQTRNQLVGFQLGGDLWYNLMPGVKLGTELKSGVYHNQVEQATLISSNSIDTLGNITQNLFVNETADNDRCSYLTQLSASCWYRLSYSLAVKSSFEMIYVDNVALAPENINPVPISLTTARQAAVGLNDDGEVLYTGFSVNGEYTW